MPEARGQRSESRNHKAAAVCILTDLRLLTPDFLSFTLRCALCAMLLLLFPFPSFSASDNRFDSEDKKQQIEQIENDLKREKEKLLRFDVKERDILEQLSIIEQEIDEKKRIVNEIDTGLKDKKEALKEHRQNLERLESSLKSLEASVAERIAAFYKNAKRGYLKVLLATKDLDILNHNIKYLREIMDEDRKVMEDLAEKQAEYRREMTLIEEQLNAVARLEESENRNLTELKEALEREVLLLAKIHREKEFYEVAVKELQSAADYLKGTIDGMGSKSAKESDLLPDNFNKSKGKLPLPLSGRVLKTVKKKVKRDYSKQKGIYIEGPSGAEVKAVYRGRVDYSGILKGYGQVIVINHGDRFFTISAYLKERKKSEGDTVLAGDIIGTVGEAGLTTGPALYFEMRKGEENLNPLKWLKVN